MMRLPRFRWRAPARVEEAVKVLAAEGPRAMVVAGGTDLWPNMKRRHQTPRTVVGLRRIASLRGVDGDPARGLRIGPMESLTAVEAHAAVGAAYPALRDAVRSISTPILRNMGTLGGNVCLDTRCTYYDQSYEWRRSVDFCMKCDGTVCWVAPGSEKCLAIQSSDTAPVLCAIGAKVRLRGPDGDRDVAVEDLYREDGIAYLAKRPDEVLTDVLLPPTNGWRAAYRKLRRRGAFDFPVLGVAVRLDLDGGRVQDARIVLGAVASAPVRARECEDALRGAPLGDEAIARAAALAPRYARPLDNADFQAAWRKRMAGPFLASALRALRGP